MDVKESYADITEAFNLIGYAPEIKIEDGLMITKAYYETLK